MAAWTFGIGTVALIGVVVAVLARRTASRRPSGDDRDAELDRRWPVSDRPAGPDAEPMDLGPSPNRTAGSVRDLPTVRTWHVESRDADEAVPAPRPDHVDDPEQAPDPERLADPVAEAVSAEDETAGLPDEERPVPGDVNEHVSEEDPPDESTS